MLQFNQNGQFHLIGRRGRVVKIEEKRISLVEIEQRLLALDGIMDVAAIPLIRNGRQAIGVVVVRNKEALSNMAMLRRENSGVVLAQSTITMA